MFAHKTSCSALWNHASVRPNGDVHGCCRFKLPIMKTSGNVNKDIVSDEYEAIRQASMQGQIKECAKCFHEEDLGKYSYRNWWNDRYGADEVKVKYLQMAQDNNCNLRCVMCSSYFSTEWFKYENPDKSAKQGYISVDAELPESCEWLELVGGEPLSTNRHRTLINSHPDPSRLNVIYFTNCTYYPNPKDYELWNRCKSVEFRLSIDAWGALNDETRPPSKWEQVEKIAYHLSQHFPCQIESVLYTMNYHGMKDLSNWVKKINLPWIINMLTRPPHLDCVGLTDAQKMQLIQDLDDYDDVEAIKAHLFADPLDWLPNHSDFGQNR